jgi:Uma2 family endonuclease
MYAVISDDEFEETSDMGSFNHGYLQIRLAVLFDRLGSYTPVSELSLDVSNVDLSQFDLRSKEEIKPDISLYPKRGLSRPKDILRMKEMPILVVEVLSPRQGTYEILEKFRLYFALGIQSCWLIDPALSTVTVYSAAERWQTFVQGEVVDSKVGIRLSLSEIFS